MARPSKKPPRAASTPITGAPGSVRAQGPIVVRGVAEVAASHEAWLKEHPEWLAEPWGASSPRPRTKVALLAEKIAGVRATVDVDARGDHWLRIEGPEPDEVAVVRTPAARRTKLRPYRIRHGDVHILYGPEPGKVLLVEQPARRGRAGRRLQAGRRSFVSDDDLRAARAQWPYDSTTALARKVLGQKRGRTGQPPSRWTVSRVEKRLKLL